MSNAGRQNIEVSRNFKHGWDAGPFCRLATGTLLAMHACAFTEILIHARIGTHKNGISTNAAKISGMAWLWSGEAKESD